MSNTLRFTGYSEEFPIHPGEMITIPKGTLVECRGQLTETKRAVEVRVDHILPGTSIPVGFSDKQGNNIWSYCTRGAREEVQKIYGTTDLNTLWPLMHVDAYGNISLPSSNPEVRWAGSGGYWKSADMNQLVSE